MGNQTQTTKIPPRPLWQLILLVLPYLLVIVLYASVSMILLAPGALIVIATFFVFERVHKDAVGRFPAGWLVSTMLLFPCVYLYVFQKMMLLLLVLTPVVVIAALHAATSGRLGRWWKNQPVFGSLLYLITTAALLLVVGGRFGIPALNDDVLFELYSVPQSIHLNQAEMETAVEVVELSLQHYQRDSEDGIPQSIKARDADFHQRLGRNDVDAVYVTLWLDGKKQIRGRSSGSRLFEDLSRATDTALDSTTKWKNWVDGAHRIRLQIDLANEPVPIRPRRLHMLVVTLIDVFAAVDKRDDKAPALLYQLIYEIEPGIDGLILESGDEVGRVLPADPVTSGWLTPRVLKRSGKVREILTRVSRKAKGSGDLWTRDSTQLYRFRCFTFGRPVPDGAVVALYRGNVLRDDVDSQAILDGIEEGGNWLLRTVKEDGKFDYEYFPNRDRGSKGYNIVRHAGCVYGLFHMYNLSLSEEQLRPGANAYLEAGLRALDFARDSIRPPDNAQDPALVALIDKRGRASSGAAALTLMSLLERPTPDQVNHPVLAQHLVAPGDDELREGLGLFLLSMIDERGRVFKNYRDTLESDVVDKEPLYYPGETMLALVRFHVLTDDPRWLEGARKIGDWQVERYYDRRPNPDHWVMQALWYMYQVTGDEKYATCCLKMGDRHAREQFPPYWPPFADYFGAYRRYNDQPRTTRAASRSEAMGGVVHTAWKMGADATPYEENLLRAAEHLLEHQWRPENSYYLPNPDKARGAIRMGITDNHCRIDNNQHGVVGLHRALEVARKREGVPMAGEIALPPMPAATEQRACRVRFGDVVEPLDTEPLDTAVPGTVKPLVRITVPPQKSGPESTP